MRFGHRHAILCFYFFAQVICAHQNNDYHPKNHQRTNTKKYYPSNKIDSVRNTDLYSTNANVPKLRHSTSKFPNFDKLKTRLASLDAGDASKTNSGDTGRYRYGGDSRRLLAGDGSSVTYPRFRHHGWSTRFRTTTTTTTTPSPDEEIFNNYGDMLDEDEGDQVEDEDSNYEEDFFDTSDEDDDDNDFQAEEPTERTIPVAKQYSSMSEYKWDQFGTRQGVTEARNRQLNIRKNSEESRARAAVEHYIRVKNTGSCRNPIPKVIPVQQEYPNPAVTYTPHCTVLYRCAEDTGCCRHDGATCQYKDRVEIPLYFYVKELGSDQAKVEKLTFYNHTECECKEKQEETVTERHKRTGTQDGDSAETFNQTRHGGFDLKSRSDGPENIQIRCKCPKEFTPRIKYSSKCYCDCEESNQDCLRMKRGKEYSSLSDRLCILNNQCGIVQCEYGSYIKERGRCPRKDE